MREWRVTPKGKRLLASDGAELVGQPCLEHPHRAVTPGWLDRTIVPGVCPYCEEKLP